jgi:hypothetical protein
MHMWSRTVTTTATVALTGAAVLAGWAGPARPASALGTRGPAGARLGIGTAAVRAGSVASLTTVAGTSGAQARYVADLAASRAQAQRLVHLARLPQGAVALPGPPPGRTLADAVGTPVASNLVERTSYWSLPLSESSAFAWLSALQPPLGLRSWSSSQGSGGDGVGYSGPSTAWWQASYLDLSVVAAGAGGSYLRVDGAVVPWDPRPLADDAVGPRLRVSVAGGCPAGDQGAVGVSNPGRQLSARLLPPGNPEAALACAYGDVRVVAPVPVLQPVGTLTRGTMPPVPAAFGLARSALLGQAARATLASALSRASLAHTDGTVMACPAQRWGALLLVFAYRSGPDVDLWAQGDVGGCGSVSNGWVRTGVNPSLYSLQMLLAPYAAPFPRCGPLPEAVRSGALVRGSAQLQKVDHEHQCVVRGDPRAG